MIPKNEILDIATSSNLLPHVIEKDYVLGWLLAGINQHITIKDWVFKGGTCLKKCYFETYRFSEDLDFTLSDPSHINESFLTETFTEISEWIQEQTGIEIPADKLIFDIYENPRGIMSCQGRVYYRGPTSPSSPNQFPRIKLDLSVDEILVDTPVINPVNHIYSDKPDNSIQIQCYSYEEVFAEKIRALGERTRPRDLYDVINFYRRPESRALASAVKKILEKKCEFKAVEMPSYAQLMNHKDACENGWKQQLSHQLQALPPFESFWEELPESFDWLYATETISRKTLNTIPPQQGSISSKGPTDLWHYDAPTQQLSLLERIQFAAANHLCIEMQYRRGDGIQHTYLIEPYALNTTSQGHLLLHAIKHETQKIRAFRTDRIISAKITETTFKPSYRIDLIPHCLKYSKTSPSLPFPSSSLSSRLSHPKKQRISQTKPKR